MECFFSIKVFNCILVAFLVAFKQSWCSSIFARVPGGNQTINILSTTIKFMVDTAGTDSMLEPWIDETFFFPFSCLSNSVVVDLYSCVDSHFRRYSNLLVPPLLCQRCCSQHSCVACKKKLFHHRKRWQKATHHVQHHFHTQQERDSYNDNLMNLMQFCGSYRLHCL